MDSSASAKPAPVRLRAPGPGDLGWIVHRHGALYAREYGWNARFEALVADIAAQFLRSEHADKERCWIAEHAGRIAGTVLLMRKSDEIGQLRLLYVEPDARGQGVGETLVDSCIDGARAAGYRRLTLFTTNVLVAARRLYEKKGFRLVSAEPVHAFGPALQGETWTLALAPC